MLEPVYVKIPRFIEILGFEYSEKHCIVIFEVGIEEVQEMEFMNFLSYCNYLTSKDK